SRSRERVFNDTRASRSASAFSKAPNRRKSLALVLGGVTDARQQPTNSEGSILANRDGSVDGRRPPGSWSITVMCCRVVSALDIPWTIPRLAGWRQPSHRIVRFHILIL